MTYLFIPFVLIAVFILYALYLIFFKKDFKQLKLVLLPGVFFIAIWIALYYFILK
jgi:hypothetical protein